MTTHPQPIPAWWFGRADGRLQHRAHRKPVVAGGFHAVRCEPVLCNQGLHASVRALDALRYAPDSPCVARVLVSDSVVHGTDKLAGKRREYLWVLPPEATERVLREFARRCALDVAHLWEMPAIVREYLETGREEIRTTARDAARDAARAAAWDVARDAAWAAARDAAWDVARAAAWAAAWDAAWDVARAAARSQQNERLEQMLVAAARAEGVWVADPEEVCGV